MKVAAGTTWTWPILPSCRPTVQRFHGQYDRAAGTTWTWPACRSSARRFHGQFDLVTGATWTWLTGPPCTARRFYGQSGLATGTTWTWPTERRFYGQSNLATGTTYRLRTVWSSYRYYMDLAYCWFQLCARFFFRGGGWGYGVASVAHTLWRGKG